jgi:hypothetical protein
MLKDLNDYTIAQCAEDSRSPSLWADVVAYGADPTGVLDSSNAIDRAAKSVATAGGVVFFRTGTYKVSANITIGANVVMRFNPGATMSVDSGKTVTVNGLVQSVVGTPWSGSGTVTAKTNLIAIDNDSTTSAIYIKQDGNIHAIEINKTATGNERCIEITNAGTGTGIKMLQNGAGPGIAIAQAGEQVALLIEKTSTGTYKVISITQAGTGEVIFIDKTHTGGGNMVYLHNDGTGNAINIKQDGNAAAIQINQYGQAEGIWIEKLHDGLQYPLRVHATTVGTGVHGCVKVQHDGNGICIDLTKDGTGGGNVIDICNAGTGYGYKVWQYGAAEGLYILQDVDHGAILVEKTTSNGAGAGDLITLHNDGTGAGITIQQDGVAIPLVISGTNGNCIQVQGTKTPASGTAAGAAGTICWDASYIYVCTATNTWKRAALGTW